MEYICEYNNSIPSILCNEIIELFEKEDNKYPGITMSGINKNIKDTTDFIIPKNNEKWKKIELFLYRELSSKLNKYLKKNQKQEYGIEYNIFNNKKLHTRAFMIQKYDKQKGKYIYHDDFALECDSARMITFLWYLNTVDEGGHTLFWDNFKVQPKEGKLIFFPSFWCYPHRGMVPISSNKYIITGWLYANQY
jgi:hypothetical protein